MNKKLISVIVLAMVLLAAFALLLTGQEIKGVITSTERPAIAVPDLRGSGDAQKFMDGFNATLWDELAGSGALKMVAKSLYPLEVPQQPSDFKPPVAPTAPLRGRGQTPPQPVRNGPWLTDWSGPPPNANFLAFGYTGVQDGRLVLFGWLYNVGQPDPASAQVIGKLYYGSLDAEGSKKVAREFAADILQQFGAKSLAGSKIFFVSDRTGSKEIWSMDYDGSNQKQLTSYKTTSWMPAISPDGRQVAFVTMANEGRGEEWQIRIHATDSGRKLTFVGPTGSSLVGPEYSPD